MTYTFDVTLVGQPRNELKRKLATLLVDCDSLPSDTALVEMSAYFGMFSEYPDILSFSEFIPLDGRLPETPPFEKGDARFWVLWSSRDSN